MGTGWYYMASGWIRKAHRIGPISEAELLTRIQKGKIVPETLLQSEKTRGKWVPMSAVGPAIKYWKELHPDADLSEINLHE